MAWTDAGTGREEVHGRQEWGNLSPAQSDQSHSVAEMIDLRGETVH